MKTGKPLDEKITYQTQTPSEPKKPPPMVLVVWEDAKVIDEGDTWVENKKAEYKPHIFHQVGFLTLLTEEGLHLTSSWSDDLIAKRDQIPRAMVRSITYLEQTVPKPPKRRSRVKDSER